MTASILDIWVLSASITMAIFCRLFITPPIRLQNPCRLCWQCKAAHRYPPPPHDPGVRRSPQRLPSTPRCSPASRPRWMSPAGQYVPKPPAARHLSDQRLRCSLMPARISAFCSGENSSFNCHKIICFYHVLSPSSILSVSFSLCERKDPAFESLLSSSSPAPQNGIHRGAGYHSHRREQRTGMVRIFLRRYRIPGSSLHRGHLAPPKRGPSPASTPRPYIRLPFFHQLFILLLMKKSPFPQENLYDINYINFVVRIQAFPTLSFRKLR